MIAIKVYVTLNLVILAIYFSTDDAKRALDVTKAGYASVVVGSVLFIVLGMFFALPFAVVNFCYGVWEGMRK